MKESSLPRVGRKQLIKIEPNKLIDHWVIKFLENIEETYLDMVQAGFEITNFDKKMYRLDDRAISSSNSEQNDAQGD